MSSRVQASWVMALLGCVVGATTAAGQVVERDTKVTGPRGRTIERSIRSERGPGFVDRQVEIKRPGGTVVRDTRIQQPGGFGPRPGHPGGPPHPGYPGGPPRPRFVERDVVVERDVFVPGPPLIAPFVAPFLSFSFGSPPPPPPPPAVVYVPEPVYVAAPGIIATPPVAIAAPPVVQVPVSQGPVEPPLPPPVADAIGRLSSLHHQSRRDGALTLGNLGDDRAVPPLMDRLEHDFDREVRVAAAWALGEIGDPRAGIVLQRAALYDRRQEVRTAAGTAYQRIPKPGQEVATSPAVVPSSDAGRPVAAIESRPLNRQPTSASVDPGPLPAPPSDNPPPFPIPDDPR